MQRRAAIGVGGDLAQIRRHFLNEANRRRAAQDARCDAAAEWRVIASDKINEFAAYDLRQTRTLKRQLRDTELLLAAARKVSGNADVIVNRE